MPCNQLRYVILATDSEPVGVSNINHIVIQGHIAKLIGSVLSKIPLSAHHIKISAVAALKFLSPDVNPPVPWHRVISSSGTISSRGPGTQGAQRQREALEAEGVEVTTGQTGDMRVDVRQWGWFPDVGTVGIGLAAQQDEDDPDQDGGPQNQ
ncbi:hypothetical protein H0H92_005712 [Tricholoma furcatifolium]|nr:hypothetical protein H0H92_005712 [Tricholoma furcatifolium]